MKRYQIFNLWKSSELRGIVCCCSVTKSCLTPCDPMDCSIPGSSVLPYLPKFVQIHVHWVSDAIQSSHPLPLHSPFALGLAQHQGLFQWVGTAFSSIQFSSITQSGPTLCDPMNHSTPGLPVHHQLPEFTQTHVHWVGDAIQPSHPLWSPSPPAPNSSQHQGLFQWVNFSHEVAEVLEFQLQHQSFQWTPRTDLL